MSLTLIAVEMSMAVELERSSRPLWSNPPKKTRLCERRSLIDPFTNPLDPSRVEWSGGIGAERCGASGGVVERIFSTGALFAVGVTAAGSSQSAGRAAGLPLQPV